MTSELKPCPFCGSEAQQRSSVIERGDYGDTIRYNVGCPQCDASAGWDDYEDVAVSAWNRRAPSEAATPFEVVSFEPWKDGVVRIRIACDEPEGRVCHTFYARQEYVPSEAVGLLREALRMIDMHVEGADDLDTKIRRFLAAQEGT